MRIVLADDHGLFRAGVRMLLSQQANMDVVAEAMTSQEVLTAVREHHPDLILLDVSMPGRGALEVLQEIRRISPKTAVLMLTAQPEDYFAVRCLREGASGYVTKDTPIEVLVEAIRKVEAGGRYISPVLAERIAYSVGPDAELKPHERLSRRELQVMLLIAAGRTPTLIAEELCLSVKTVSTYRTRVLEKMGLANNSEIVVYSVREGLVT